jgi:hypothetical protein
MKQKSLFAFTVLPVSSFLAALSYLYLIPSFILLKSELLLLHLPGGTVSNMVLPSVYVLENSYGVRKI